MKPELSFNIQIWLGLREGYTDIVHSIDEVYAECQQICKGKKICLTVTPTRFFYVGGWEEGAIIGLINYPRFPKTKNELFSDAWDIAGILKHKFNQLRASITTPTKTYTLGAD